MTYPDRWDPPRDDVRAEVFTRNGKWKYEVSLDYTDTETVTGQNGYCDPSVAALHALCTATRRGTSGVVFEELPASYALVVFDPPNGWPVLVAEREL